jgi:hypothetical protein
MRLILFFLSLILISACKKKDRVSGTRVNLMVVNTSPNSGTVDVLQNLNLIGQYTYLSGLLPVANYSKVDSGFNNYQLRKGSDQIASWVFAGQKFYHTLFICDSLIPSKAKYFFVEDNLDTVGLGREKQSKIRLIHLSPDVDTVQLMVQPKVNTGWDSAVVREMEYFGKFDQAVLTNAGSFQTFFGDTTMSFKIRRKADSTVIKSYQFNFQKGKLYSLILKGYNARSGKDSLSLSIINHN